MPARLNHLAVLAAAIAFFLLGYLWYGLIFTGLWTSLVGPLPMNSSPTLFAESFLCGWVMAYFVGIALTNHEHPQPVRHGIEFGIFMGLGIYATMLLNGYLYTSKPIGLWAIDAGYVVLGLAVVGAIVSGWRKKVAA